jgi:hypothetical protein
MLSLANVGSAFSKAFYKSEPCYLAQPKWTKLHESLAEKTPSLTERSPLYAAHGLKTIGLQPFLFYEDLIDHQEHAVLIVNLHMWFDIADALDVYTIQIPSNSFPHHSSQWTYKLSLPTCSRLQT